MPGGMSRLTRRPLTKNLGTMGAIGHGPQSRQEHHLGTVGWPSATGVSEDVGSGQAKSSGHRSSRSLPWSHEEGGLEASGPQILKGLPRHPPFRLGSLLPYEGTRHAP